MTGAEQAHIAGFAATGAMTCSCGWESGVEFPMTDWANHLADALTAAEAALREARGEIAAYRASLSMHHNIAHLSREAIDESIGGPCQICARAQDERRAALARAGERDG